MRNKKGGRFTSPAPALPVPRRAIVLASKVPLLIGDSPAAGNALKKAFSGHPARFFQFASRYSKRPLLFGEIVFNAEPVFTRRSSAALSEVFLTRPAPSAYLSLPKPAQSCQAEYPSLASSILKLLSSALFSRAKKTSRTFFLESELCTRHRCCLIRIQFDKASKEHYIQ
jgi:hypothetical protein